MLNFTHFTYILSLKYYTVVHIVAGYSRIVLSKQERFSVGNYLIIQLITPCWFIYKSFPFTDSVVGVVT